MNWQTPLAVIVGAGVIAFSVAFTGRYEIAAANSENIYRLDRWTGEIRQCGVNMTDGDELRRRILQDGAMIASCEYPERLRPIAGAR